MSLTQQKHNFSQFFLVENFSTSWQNIEIQLIILQTLKVKTFDQSQTKLQTGEWNTWNTFELILIHRFFTNFNLSKMKQIKWGTSRQCEKRCKRSWRVGGMGWCPFMDRMTISRRVMQFTRTIIAAWSSALMYYTNRHTHTVCHNNTGYNRNPNVNKKIILSHNYCNHKKKREGSSPFCEIIS